MFFVLEYFHLERIVELANCSSHNNEVEIVCKRELLPTCSPCYLYITSVNYTATNLFQLSGPYITASRHSESTSFIFEDGTPPMQY